MPAADSAQVRVVGVALLRRGPSGPEVLAARRTSPPELAGRWELPGGKCDVGESLADAAVREVAEELGCEVRVLAELPRSVPIRPGYALHVVTAELVDGVPEPTEHDAVRWLGPHALGEVDWLDPDVPFLDDLLTLLEECDG